MRYNSPLQFLAALLPFLGAAPVLGQATVTGVVFDAGTHRPIADVLVTLDTTRRTTAADGRFRFNSVPAGSRALHLEHIAYVERMDTLAVHDGEHIELEIPIAGEAIELAPLSVEVRSRHLMEVGFYERSIRGHGIYIGRDQLDGAKSTRLGDFLAQVPGVRRAIVNGDNTRIDMRGGKSISQPCFTQYWVDGTAMAAEGGSSVLDNLAPLNVEGIEVYRGASETPIQFDFGRTSCGAIIIWTRRY